MIKTIPKRDSTKTETRQCYCSRRNSKENQHSVVVANSSVLSLSRFRLRCCLKSLGRVVYPMTMPPLSLLKYLFSSSSVDASIVFVDYSGPSSIPRCLCHCLRSLRRVVYSSSSANSSVVVAESSFLSSSAENTVVVANSLGL